MIDLPIASFMRSKYGAYPEYHMSLDDLLSFISQMGLEGAFNVLQRCLAALEVCYTYRTLQPCCEPQLGKRGYPSFSTKSSYNQVNAMIMNFLAYADGSSDLLEIAETIDVDMAECAEIAKHLSANTWHQAIRPGLGLSTKYLEQVLENDEAGCKARNSARLETFWITQ